ncbi:DUF4395 domain-containing protein [Kitasatospora nipponensis]|uniref:DUF4395 domain-containing protein n=1 Tax=Kitasatospora nipponensis TaxID=258049 RepID=A0ABN1X6U1_9ACTN
MQIDPRGPRSAAALTTLVLAAALITASWPLPAAQAVVFALGALGRSPYGWLYRVLLRPRLGPPTELEDARPPRFAQLVGLLFAVPAALGYLLGANWLGTAACACALAAAFLNAAFGYCLGCEVYLLLRRGQARFAVTGR